MPDIGDYPATAAARDRFVLERRGASTPSRPLASPGRHRRRRARRGRPQRSHGNRAADRTRVSVALRDVRLVDVHDRVGHAARSDSGATGGCASRAAPGAPFRFDGMKLYNAGSFFDPRAVPDADYDAVAATLAGLSLVVVESHPALVGPRVDRLLASLTRHRLAVEAATQLEVAMGLETAHPVALERLNKRFTLERFTRAARALAARRVSLRVFLLIYAALHSGVRAGRVAPALGRCRLCLRRISRVVGSDSIGQWHDGRAGGYRFVRGAWACQTSSAASRWRSRTLRVAAGSSWISGISSGSRDVRSCLAPRRERLHRMNLDQRTVSPHACATCDGAISR